MKIFLLICLAIGLASTEKLDRTYLPPPGSKFSGGSPGDIQVPLEFPKETYLTGQPQRESIPEIELGINRRPKPIGNVQSPTQRPGFTKYRNTYPVPQTTTSYAITQTTTFAPPEEYEGLDQGSGFLNTTGVEQAGLPNYLQEQTFQKQPNQGKPGISPAYNQYQQGQNLQSTLAPYGGSTQRPFFESNRKPEPYLPPVPSKGQTISAQNNLGYPSGQPQGPTYQDGQQFSTTYRPLLNQLGITSLPANQHNQFTGNVNIPSSIAGPQYQGQRLIPKPNRPNVDQQNLNQFPGSQNFVTSTVGPQYQDKTPGQYVQNQIVPSTVEPQYQNGQRIINPGSNLQNQYISSTTPPQYQDGQSIFTPGSNQQRYQQKQHNYPMNQIFPSSVLQGQHAPSNSAPQYQGSQQFFKPGTSQEMISNQGLFGSPVPNQQNQKYPGNENFAPSTAAPQFQDGQRFITSGSDIQFAGNQNIPSTVSPQYQDSQRVFRPGSSQDAFLPNQPVFGSQVPSQQNQNQYIRNRNYPSTSAAPQLTNSVQFTTPGSIQQNQYSSQGEQNFPSSTVAPQYQFTSPESVQQSQYLGNPNIPGDRSQYQNGQRLSSPESQQNDFGLLNKQGEQSGNQQFPSTAAPQYQSTFLPTPGSNQQGLIDINQYPSSTVAPQQFVTGQLPQYGSQSIQTLPGTLPPSQLGTGPQGSTSTDYNQDAGQAISGPFPTRNYVTPDSGIEGQGRPERPQAAFDRNAEILNYENVLTPEGYSYSYDTSNGIHADEIGAVGNGTRAQGGYSYTGDDGKTYSVFYSADQNGFQPRGDHLPTPPPIPEAIQRVIEQANKDKESGISDDGSYNEEKYGYKKYDGNLNQLRRKNKIVTPSSGADIPNLYENRIGTQNKKQFSPTEGKQAYNDDETRDVDEEDKVDYENLEDEEVDMNEKEVNNQRIPSKFPTKMKNLTVEGNVRKYNNFNRRPASDEEHVGDVTKELSISEETDLDESQDQIDETDFINYKDDPNSRTNFHGTNKYLPKPKGDRRRPMSPTSKGVGKQRKPINRKPETSHNGTFEDEQDIIDNDRIRKPSRKNKISQIVKEQSTFGQPGTLGNGDDLNTYGDYANEDNVSGDDMKSTKGSRPNKPENNQLGNKNNSKPIKSKNGGYKTVSKNENFDAVREKGYEYTPPQKKTHSGEAIEFPTRTSVTDRPKYTSQKESQTTLRPFMTPKVYGEDNGESTDEDIAEPDHGKPQSPSTSQRQGYSGSRKDGQKYNLNVTPGKTESGETISITGEYGTTPSQIPSGRFQSTSRPQYGEDTSRQNELNKPNKIPSSRRPGNKIFFDDNTPNEGASTVNNAFISTTPLPPSVSNSDNAYQHPGQYKPINDNSRVYDTNTQEDVRLPGTNDRFRILNFQVPSTTYRPNYVFGDRTLAPNGSVTVDGFGRPILSTMARELNGEFQNNQPGRVEETFRPTEGRFGGTGPTQGTSEVYQGSTSAPAENFSGPKQPQRYDPQTGYYYK